MAITMTKPERLTVHGKRVDSQRAKVYKAEQAAFHPFGAPDLFSKDSIKRFLQDSIDLPEIKGRWGGHVPGSSALLRRSA